ncbi:DUF6263 family protein [Paraflavitalea pollutisoli]|uniref:DUF6263 family protein n=1 Tax=Paraflavitalea pollutisoli TaxID=3034143 RepID=UPI0023EB6109|nr:DUF6263 family protein [Paraflavitalea sp. H1-2-19X]
MKRNLPIVPSLCSLLFLLLCCVPALQAQTLDLRLKPAVGEKYSYFFDYQSEVFTDQGNLTMEVGMGLSLEVTGADGSNKLIKATYNRAVMKMDMGTNSMDIDTDQPKPAFDAANPMTVVALLFHGLRGQSFTMTMSETGELSNIAGFEKVVENMIDSAAGGGDVPEAMRQGMRDGMSKQFNAESMKEQIQQSFNIFSGKPVKVGDSWVKKLETHGAKNMKMTNTYTVQSITAKEVLLSLRCVIDEITTEANMTMNGTQEGTLVVDPKTGMLIRSEINQALAGAGGSGMKITGKSVTTRL